MKHIVLSLVISLLLPFQGYAQTQIQISGTVLDSQTKEPLMGASVIEKGSSNGTITDIDGRFNLTATSPPILVIRYMGYISQNIDSKSSQVIQVLLQENKQDLDEVVVIGYGVQKKSDITGAISSVSGKELSKVPVGSAIQALQGKATGVQIIQNTGAPGASSTIKIRGTGTVNDADPLYVVDGFIVDNITHINPGDIANIEILKDAASSAVYGARAANGVVLVTTKSGASGKIQISFDSYFGVSEPWKTIPVMQTADYALMQDYMNGVFNYSVDGQLYYSKDPLTNELYYDNKKFNRIDTIARNSPSSWWDAVTRTGFVQQYNLSVSGGNEKNTFMVSTNYYDDQGIVNTSDYKRFTTRINSNNKIASWLTSTANIAYTYEDRHIAPEGSESILKQALYYEPMSYTYNNRGYWGSDHPLAVLMRNHNSLNRHRIDMNLNLAAEIGKYVTYQFKVSDYIITESRSNFFEVNKLDLDFQMPGDLTSVYKYQDIVNKFEINNLFNFFWKNSTHDINVLIGQTLETNSYNFNESSSKGAESNDPALWYPSSSYTGYRNAGLARTWSALGFVGRINYNILDRYLFQANFRADASSVFAASERWGLFPSASVGWKFSSEPFLQQADWLTLGKLRFGWGMLGNNRIDELARYTLVSHKLSNGTGAPFSYSYGVGNHILYPGMTSSTIGNPNIRWEKTTTYNLGLDLGFFNNSLTMSIEMFNKLTTDMLLRVPVTISAGFNDAPMSNAGSVRNMGVELTVSYKGNIGNFKYEIGANFSHIQNQVVSLGTGNEPIYGGWLGESSVLDFVTKTEVGRPIGCFYGYVTDGIFNTYEEVKQSAQYEYGKNIWEQTTRPGDFRFKDINGDGKITAEDRAYLGSPHPDFVFGIPLMFSYWGFDLTLFFQGQTGNKIFNVMDYYLNSATFGNVYEDLRSKHWSGQLREDRAFFPQNLNGTVPDLSPSDINRNFRASDFMVKDGSYIRLQDIRLTYNFSENLVRKMKLQTFSLFVGVHNLFTITAYNGFDPEVGKVVGTEGNNLNLGVDHGNYPQARTVTFGLRLSL